MNIQGNTLVKGVDEFHVVIPEGVEIIGDEAFRECKGLTEIKLPSSLTSIGEGAFASCSGLTGIQLPEGLTNIGRGAFIGCTGLSRIQMPEGLTSIGNFAFNWCTELTSVVFPSTLTSLGDDAFGACTSLTSIQLPEGLTSVGNHAFSECSGLTGVVLPSTLTSIGSKAFYGCTELSLIVPPCRVAPDSFKDCYLVLNASGSIVSGSVVINPIIIGLRKRLLALWSQNVRRQGRLRQSGKKYKLALSGGALGYERVQANRERNEVNKLWREIKRILEGTERRADVVAFLFAKLIRGGELLVRMNSYLNQPRETKVFQRVLQDLGITDSGVRLELRF